MSKGFTKEGRAVSKWRNSVPKGKYEIVSELRFRAIIEVF